MRKQLVSILSDLITIPSPYPPGTSVEICAYAAKRLKKAGYKVEITAKTRGVDNVVARMKGKGRGPVIAFNAHVDTVGVGERANWKSDPFKALVKAGLVHGLGAGNCKGSMAVQLWLAEEIARRGGPASGELLFTFVADEENLGPDGMEFLRKSGKVRPDALILGAQTENNLIVAEREAAIERLVAEKTRPCAASLQKIGAMPPTDFDPKVIDLVRAKADALALSNMDMPSGAGHDAMHIATLCPAGMIFVPCEHGISHNEIENATPADLAAGARVLVEVLVALANR